MWFGRAACMGYRLGNRFFRGQEAKHVGALRTTVRRDLAPSFVVNWREILCDFGALLPNSSHIGAAHENDTVNLCESRHAPRPDFTIHSTKLVKLRDHNVRRTSGNGF